MDPSTVFIFDKGGDGAIETTMVTSPAHHDDLLGNYYYDGLPNLRSIMSEDDSVSTDDSSSGAQSPNHIDIHRKTRGNHDDACAGRVRFSEVHVREHSLVIGNHPCCRDSLPISLDWVHTDDQCFDIDDFEYSRNMTGGRGERGNLPRMDFWSRRVRLQTVAGMSERDFIREEQRRRQEAERNAMELVFRPEPISYERNCNNDDWEETEKEMLDKAFNQPNCNEPAALYHNWEDEERMKWQHHYESDPSYYDFATPPSFPANMVDIQVLED